ncbi:MAG: tRNA (adenosine(37)-N6)-dimethylallyltransferase MiaA [Clostridiales bacterium]|nr:tRNA (adenosine(37)-N6)-dimethylallyltransferase MiaA [Clostridiales bacterium]
MKPKVVIIAGPTASGKTGLSIKLAKQINGEIVSCDSMQIYKEMNIGTAKPTIEEMDGIKHYMFDVVYPNEEFNVAVYKEMAEKCINEILEKGKTPILVGGTGLYIEALINNIEFAETEIDEKYRNELEKLAKEQGNEVIYNMLKEVDPKACEKIHINNTKRIIRALEVYKQTGKNITYHNEMSKQNEAKYEYLLYGLTMDREKLYERINIRVDIMLKDGLIKEVEEITNKYNSFPTSMQGIGYKEVQKYLKNEYTYDEMIEILKQETRRYAKRQLTWFRRYDNLTWLDWDKLSQDEMIQKICEDLGKEGINV